MRLLGVLGLSMGLMLGVGACSRQPSPKGHVLRGTLVDAETGRPVSGASFYVHVFDDATDRQVSIQPGDSSRFEVAAPASRVRLRVPDLSDAYHLYETTIDVPAEGLDHEVRLRPTHWVLLEGRILWRDGAQSRPLGEGDGDVANVRVSMPDGGRFVQNADGTFRVRVPPTRQSVSAVNTSYRLLTREIDLSLITSDTWTTNIYLSR